MRLGSGSTISEGIHRSKDAGLQLECGGIETRENTCGTAASDRVSRERNAASLEARGDCFEDLVKLSITDLKGLRGRICL